MALHVVPSFPFCSFTRLQSRSCILLGSSNINGNIHRGVRCTVVTKVSDQIIDRRSANYQPSIWDYDYIQSLRSEYEGEAYEERINKLKGDVRMILEKEVDSLDQLELVDTLQKLGLAYHFEDEIQSLLKSIYNINHSLDTQKGDLYAAALEFRLLRQHGYNVPQEVFNCFKDEQGKFKACLRQDTKGLLCLYEASYFSVEGESILAEAKNFTTEHLEEYVKHNKDQFFSMLVSHALELPLHWRMLRLEARWFIDMYERRRDMNPILLELAKLDFNMVQAAHQADLRYASKWWRNTGLGEKLSFARDRLMENFLWTIGAIFEPQFGYCRRMLTKVNALITTIDDVYDVYGTLDELELFTDAVERWDMNAMEQLPDYMKICVFALYNTINDMAFDALKDQGIHIIHCLKKAWADLCKSYLLEAKWYYSGYTPTLQEYIDNAWISISAPAVLVHAYFIVTNPVTKEGLSCLKEYANIIRWSSIIFRLADDLGTSSDEFKRGDVPKSIQCYMHETGVSEEDARQHIRDLINATWKKINEDRVANSPFTHTFINFAINLVRMAQCMYQHGDGHGVEDRETKDRVLSLIIQPIPVKLRRQYNY